jgi:NAD(P)-dependent dehydrogenase (short-subunit alcohol dehydrogenase family)
MNIIVTGASRGIGYELVKEFSKLEGATIIAISRNAAKLAALAESCNTSSSRVIALPWDLESADQSELSSRILSHVDHVDILVNNAGALVNKPFYDLQPADLYRVYQVNVFSVVSMIQQVLPLMGGKSKGHVINISSMGGFQGSSKFAGLSAYSSSKAAVACLTECLAEEMKDSNVAFNCLALGAVQTEMLEEAFPGYQAPKTAAEMAAFISAFSQSAHLCMNGKIIPVSLSNP